MKSILKAKREKPAAATAAATPDPERAPKFTPRGATKNRLLVAVTDDRIDFAAMSPEASKALNELLHKPEVQAQFGIGPMTNKFDPQHCKRLYQAFGKLLQSGAKIALHWPAPAVEKLAYTDQEQTELSVPTANVLDEFGNQWMQKNQSLIALMVVFSAITQAKIAEAAQIAKQFAAAEVAARPRVVTDIKSAKPPVSPGPEKIATE